MTDSENTQFFSSVEVHKRQDSDSDAIKTGIWGPRLSDYRELIEDYVSVARRRFNNKMAMFELQLNLLGKISLAQKNIKMFKDILKTPEHIEKYTSEKNLSDNISFADVRGQMRDEELLLSAYLDIGDSHLWRMFEFNRSLLYVLGKHPTSGPIQYGQGFISELYGWGQSILQSDITHFIINSITNFGRISDVLVRNKNGTIELKEIKSSSSARGEKRKQRLSRQKKVRDNFLSFANSGRGVIEENNVAIVNTTISLRTSLQIMKESLNEADSNGMAFRKINPYVNIVTFDSSRYLQKKYADDHWKMYMDRAWTDWDQPSENILPMNSLERHQYTPNRAPISILPFKENYIADLLLGKKVIFYNINLDSFARVMQTHGWSVIAYPFMDDKEIDITKVPFCILRKGKYSLGLPWTLSSLLFYDLASLKCLIELFNHFEREKISNGGYLFNFRGESNIWK